jgi:hypothetical protein
MIAEAGAKLRGMRLSIFCTLFKFFDSLVSFGPVPPSSFGDVSQGIPVGQHLISVKQGQKAA